MSVDFKDCDVCGESMCLCGEYYYCTHCNRHLCPECLVKPAEYDDDDELSKDCCPYCSGAEVHDSDLLRFLLEHFDITRETVEGLYKGITPKEVIKDFTDDKYCETLEDCMECMRDSMVDEEREEAGHGYCGADKITSVFRFQGKYYKITVKIDWNRYDKRFYYVDGSRVVSCEEIEYEEEQ